MSPLLTPGLEPARGPPRELAAVAPPPLRRCPMSPEQAAQAEIVLAKPSTEWSTEDQAFVDLMVRKGFRAQMKAIRAGVEAA